MQEFFYHCFEQFGEQTLLLIFCGPKGNGKTLRTERAMAAFVLAVITDGHPKGHTVCAQSGLMQICLGHLPHAASPAGSPLFVRWLCLCVGKLWET